jgi:hypothetical protein
MQHTRSSVLAVVLAAGLGLAGCAGAPESIRASHSTSSPSLTPTPSVTPDASEGDFETRPSTPADDEVAVDPRPTQVPTAPGGPVGVQVVLTSTSADAEGISASATVQGVSEDGGECTLRATSGTSSEAVIGPGRASASSTSCAESLAIPRAELSDGAWTVSIDYRSKDYVGSSSTAEVTVR